MTRDQVMAVTDVIRLLPLVVAVLVGVVGLWRITQAPRRERGDRSLALAIAGIAALLAAAGVLYGAAALGLGWSGSAVAGLAAGLPLTVGAAALVFVSGIGGYALLARPEIGGAAVVGVIAGPLLMAGATAAVVGITDPIRADADRKMFEEEQEQAERSSRERASQLHASARDIEVAVVTFHDTATGTNQIVVSRVRLTLVLRADVPIDFYGPDVGGYPEVRLLPEGDQGLAEMRGAWPATTGSHLPAGETAWTVDFAYTPDQLAGRMSAPPHGPGAWVLEIHIMTAAGGIAVEAPLQLEAPAST